MNMDKLVYQLGNVRSLFGSGKVIVGAEVARIMGLLSMHGSLSAVMCKRGGKMVDLGLLGKRVVTTAGVNYLVDDWDTGSDYHDSGTGSTAENIADTTLVTQAGPTTRATGTKSQPSANILRSVGTIAYTGTLAITEHGLFDQAAQGGTLWDRTVFAAINVENGDSIEFTYNCTITAGS
jgi:hypothetical protein